MGSNNNENNAAMGFAAFFLAGVVIMAAVVFAAVAFLALVVTIICIFAWNRPVTVFGEVFEPDDARAFIRRGLVGVALAFAFSMFCSALFGFAIKPEAMLYIVIAGYSAGSIGVEVLKAKEAEEAAKAAALLPPPNVIEHAPIPSQPKREASGEPFRFASWDDEIELNKPTDSDRCRGCAWNNDGERLMPGASPL